MLSCWNKWNSAASTSVIAVMLLAASFKATKADEGERLQQFWNDLYGEDTSANIVIGDDAPLFTMDVVGKADPDECFVGVGEANEYPFDLSAETCSTGRLKVNEAYVFGLTEAANGVLWFGSAPNMGCLVFGTIADSSPLPLTPYSGPDWACEYNSSGFGTEAGLQARLGDWRPPSIRTYNPQTGNVEKKIVSDPLLEDTLGLRAAGALGDIVLLAGPTITGVGGALDTAGINMFAFHTETGNYLGSRQLPGYSNIRKFIVVGGALYTGVLVNKSDFPGDDTQFGAVLRWTGTVEEPFLFGVVGWLDGEAAELVEHDGRIFASTWPDFSKLFDSDDYDYAGLWMSPVLGGDGLNPEDADFWQKVWSAIDYEVDEVAARMYNGGALASYQGYLFWGSLHAPLSAGFAHSVFYNHIDPGFLGIPNIGAIVAALLGSHRPINIFRGRNFGTATEEKEVLYGLSMMPAYVNGWWILLKNKMGEPLYGTAGFGNAFNTYTWTMAVHNDVLYCGTMDWSHTLTSVMVPVLAQSLFNPFPEFELPGTTHGADLFAFPSSQESAVLVDKGGLGNYGSYGIRTMITTANNELYLGMANAMNLMTDPNDDKPEGGWELIRVDPCIPECLPTTKTCEGFGCIVEFLFGWLVDLWAIFIWRVSE